MCSKQERRDEWSHLLRLLNIMNNSTFSCSHFSHFLSDPPTNQKAMSKRGQEQASKEGSPMAKPKPTSPIEAKARPMSPVSHSNDKLSTRSTSAQELSNPENVPEATAGTSGVFHTSKDPVESSQALKQENAQDTEVCEQDFQGTSSGSTCVRKLTRAVITKETKMEFRNMKITDCQYLTTFGIEATKTNILIQRLFMSSSMKAAIHLGLNYAENLETLLYMSFEQIQSFFNITKKLLLDNPGEILNVKTIDSTSPCCTRCCQLTTRSYDDGGKQKCESTQIPCCVLEGCPTSQKQTEDGQVKWKKTKGLR